MRKRFIIPVLFVILPFSILACNPEANGEENLIDDTTVLGPLPADKGKITVEAGAYTAWDCGYDVSKAVWGKYKALTVDSLGVSPTKADKLNKYGSWESGPTLAATGFFRTDKYRGRWVLVDPVGKIHIECSAVTLSPGGGKVNKNYFSKKWADKKAWIKSTMDDLLGYGFHGSGAWGDEEAIKYYNSVSEDHKCTYTPVFNIMSDFGYALNIAEHHPGNTAYPNSCIPVFHPDFKAFCEKNIPPFVEKYKNDPNVVGYFSDNEMPLRLANLSGYLTLDENDYGHKAAVAWLAEKGISQDKINDNVRLEFVGYVAETYYRIVSEVLKKADPNHLYLGSRLSGTSKTFSTVYSACAKYCDIVSINYYGQWEVRALDIQRWESWADAPFMITEFYTKGEDSGLGNTCGDGWIVHDQKSRGLHYENFTIGLLRSNACVGWTWFKYLDNDPTATNPEPSNVDANKGIYDNYYEPYTDLVNSMTRLNTVRYSILSQNWLYTK